VIAKFKRGTVIIPIFQKNGWIKIGHAATGVTGWVKKEDLHRGFFPRIYIKTYYHGPKQAGKTMTIYGVTTFGKISPEQMRTLLKKLKLQKHQINRTIEDFVEKSVQNFNQLNEELRDYIRQNMKEGRLIVPVFQPIFFIPHEKDGSQTNQAQSPQAQPGVQSGAQPAAGPNAAHVPRPDATPPPSAVPSLNTTPPPSAVPSLDTAPQKAPVKEAQAQTNKAESWWDKIVQKWKRIRNKIFKLGKAN